jgi:hypothetical protein
MAGCGGKPKSMKKGGMVQKPMPYKKGGMVFKPCAKCPSPAKCKAAGQCMMKSGK